MTCAMSVAWLNPRWIRRCQCSGTGQSASQRTLSPTLDFGGRHSDPKGRAIHQSLAYLRRCNACSTAPPYSNAHQLCSIGWTRRTMHLPHTGVCSLIQSVIGIPHRKQQMSGPIRLGLHTAQKGVLRCGVNVLQAMHRFGNTIESSWDCGWSQAMYRLTIEDREILRTKVYSR